MARATGRLHTALFSPARKTSKARIPPVSSFLIGVLADSLGPEVCICVDLVAEVQHAVQISRHPRESIPQGHLLHELEAVAAHTEA